MIATQPFNRHIIFKTVQRHFQENHYRPLNTKQILKMPLVDPVTNSAGGDKTAEWQSKLVGKKLGESSDAVVCSIYHLPGYLYITNNLIDLCKGRAS